MNGIKKDRCGYDGYECVGLAPLNDLFVSWDASIYNFNNIPVKIKGITKQIDIILDMTIDWSPSEYCYTVGESDKSWPDPGPDPGPDPDPKPWDPIPRYPDCEEPPCPGPVAKAEGEEEYTYAINRKYEFIDEETQEERTFYPGIMDEVTKTDTNTWSVTVPEPTEDLYFAFNYFGDWRCAIEDYLPPDPVIPDPPCGLEGIIEEISTADQGCDILGIKRVSGKTMVSWKPGEEEPDNPDAVFKITGGTLKLSGYSVTVEEKEMTPPFKVYLNTEKSGEDIIGKIDTEKKDNGILIGSVTLLRSDNVAGKVDDEDKCADDEGKRYKLWKVNQQMCDSDLVVDNLLPDPDPKIQSHVCGLLDLIAALSSESTCPSANIKLYNGKVISECSQKEPEYKDYVIRIQEAFIVDPQKYLEFRYAGEDYDDRPVFKYAGKCDIHNQYAYLNEKRLTYLYFIAGTTKDRDCWRTGEHVGDVHYEAELSGKAIQDECGNTGSFFTNYYYKDNYKVGTGFVFNKNKLGDVTNPNSLIRCPLSLTTPTYYNCTNTYGGVETGAIASTVPPTYVVTGFDITINGQIVHIDSKVDGSNSPIQAPFYIYLNIYAEDDDDGHVAYSGSMSKEKDPDAVYTMNIGGVTKRTPENLESSAKCDAENVKQSKSYTKYSVWTISQDTCPDSIEIPDQSLSLNLLINAINKGGCDSLEIAHVSGKQTVAWNAVVGKPSSYEPSFAPNQYKVTCDGYIIDGVDLEITNSPVLVKEVYKAFTVWVVATEFDSDGTPTKGKIVITRKNRRPKDIGHRDSIQIGAVNVVYSDSLDASSSYKAGSSYVRTKMLRVSTVDCLSPTTSTISSYRTKMLFEKLNEISSDCSDFKLTKDYGPTVFYESDLPVVTPYTIADGRISVNGEVYKVKGKRLDAPFKAWIEITTEPKGSKGQVSFKLSLKTDQSGADYPDNVIPLGGVRKVKIEPEEEEEEANVDVTYDYSTDYGTGHGTPVTVETDDIDDVKEVVDLSKIDDDDDDPEKKKPAKYYTAATKKAKLEENMYMFAVDQPSCEITADLLRFDEEKEGFVFKIKHTGGSSGGDSGDLEYELYTPKSCD